MPCRVLLADYTSSFGGAFEQISGLVSNLHGDGRFQIAVASGQSAAVLQQKLGSDIQSYELPTWEKDRRRASRRKHSILHKLSEVVRTELPWGRRMNEAISEFKPDVVHLNNLLNAQLSGVFASKLRFKKCVCCHQDFEYESALVKFAARIVDRHIAISRVVSDDLVELGIPESKISLIHLGVDTQKFNPQGPTVDLGREFNLPAHAKTFAIFGRLVSWKGQDVLIRAAAKVFEEVPNSYALIVGDSSDADDHFKQTLLKLSQDLGVESRVIFAGYRSDIPELLRSVDVVVHASTRPEPFGMVVAEGMACGRAVVAMAEGGPLDIVEDWKSGRLIKPRDDAALAATIIELLRDEQMRAQLGTEGRLRVEQNFSSKQTAAKYAELYLQLASK